MRQDDELDDISASADGGASFPNVDTAYTACCLHQSLTGGFCRVLGHFAATRGVPILIDMV